jgi:O-antigen/teichoic acid export membrane protein
VDDAALIGDCTGGGIAILHSEGSRTADGPTLAVMADNGVETVRTSTLRRNIAATYSAYVINGVLSVVVVPLALKHFGSDGYGMFAIYNVLALCCALLGTGMDKHFVRLLASRRDLPSQCLTLRIFLGLRLGLSTLLLLLLPILVLIVPAFLFPVGSQDAGVVRWLVVLAVVEYFLATPTDLMTSFCIANERIDRYSTFVVVSGLYRYALMFLGVLVLGTPFLTVAVLVSRRLIDPWVGRGIMGGIPAAAWRPHFDLATLAEMVRGSTLLTLSQVGHICMISLGSVLANALFGLSGLGLYRAAFDLSSRLWMISNGLGLVVFPRFSHMLADNDRSPSALKRVLSLRDASWAGYLVLCVCGGWIAPWVLPFLGLPCEATRLFMLLLLGTGMNAHCTLSYQFLLAAGKYLKTTLIVGFSIAVLILAIALLRSSCDILALGWGWVLSQLAYALVVDLVAGRMVGDTAGMVARQTAFKLFISLMAVSAVAGRANPVSAAAIVPLFACVAAFALALFGLRALRSPVCEGQKT